MPDLPFLRSEIERMRYQISRQRKEIRALQRGVRRRADAPVRKGKGPRWAQWKNETNEQKPKRQP
ncbi:hypothetical protein J2S34_002322 [Nitrobacter winogradskyi]|uniref:Uncharacterized protein n=2 Tax=Nitrobacter winogradskyi TaxID=913 RepID=A0ACC6AJD1_NITWI|nr:hypothetical protein [Nitrobacter winogradskyi]GEC17612.1 hypothetical protein NWI01_35040 [Nitrobacter winogradskyi]